MLIECESCKSVSELAEEEPLLVGLVSCHHCHASIELDRSSGHVLLQGGRLLEVGQATFAPGARANSVSLLPHVLEAEGKQSRIPPRPEHLRSQRPMDTSPESDARLLGLIPIQPTCGVSLTPDGRLVNHSEEAQRAPRRRLAAPFVLGAAAAALALVLLNPRSLSSPFAQSTEVPSASLAPLDEQKPEQAAQPIQRALAAESSRARDVLDVDDIVIAAEPAPVAAIVAAAPSKLEPTAPALENTANEADDSLDKAGEGTALDEAPADANGTLADDSAENEGPELAPFDRDAAAKAVEEARLVALSCRTGADDPYGSARVELTFAPSGKATSAVVTGRPFAGTQIGSCIATRFRTAHIPAFAGDYVTVSKTVTFQQAP